MSNELNFDDLGTIERSVKVKGVEYTLREASDNAVTKYRKTLQALVKFDKEGNAVGYNGSVNHTQSLLVQMCLWEGDKLVPIDKLRTWPSRIVFKLFQEVLEISEMIEEAETEETLQKAIDELQGKLDKLREDALGNEQSDTTDESD